MCSRPNPDPGRCGDYLTELRAPPARPMIVLVPPAGDAIGALDCRNKASPPPTQSRVIHPIVTHSTQEHPPGVWLGRLEPGSTPRPMRATKKNNFPRKRPHSSLQLRPLSTSISLISFYLHCLFFSELSASAVITVLGRVDIISITIIGNTTHLSHIVMLPRVTKSTNYRKWRPRVFN